MIKRLQHFPGKLRAPFTPATRPARSWKHATWGFFSGTCGILAISGLASLTGHHLLLGSFGASAVLLYGAPESPLAQPRNVLGGHLLSALVSCAMVACGAAGPVALAVAVGLSILVMHSTHTTHPPGGATALIGIHDHAGWLLVGATVLVLIAVVANNIVHHRQYPKHWW